MRVLRSGIFLSSIVASPPSTVFSVADRAAVVPMIAAVDMKFLLEPSIDSTSDSGFALLSPTYL